MVNVHAVAQQLFMIFFQCFGSGSELDPGSIKSLDPYPDPDSESGSGSGFRRAKMTHKSRKNYEISCFEVLDVLCSLDVLSGGLGVSIQNFLNIFSCNFFRFLVIKTLDPDPDPYQKKTER
jgi:hypothetical protein